MEESGTKKVLVRCHLYFAVKLRLMFVAAVNVTVTQGSNGGHETAMALHA